MQVFERAMQMFSPLGFAWVAGTTCQATGMALWVVTFAAWVLKRSSERRNWVPAALPRTNGLVAGTV